MHAILRRFDAVVEYFDDKFDVLTEAIQVMNADMVCKDEFNAFRDETRQNFSTVHAAIAATNKDVHSLDKRMGHVEGDVGVLKSDVAELKSDVTTLKTDVTILKSDVTVLKTDVTTLDTKVARLDQRLTQHMTAT